MEDDQTKRRRVGLVYDDRMCGHEAPYLHEENPDRIRAIWNKLVSANIPERCEVFKAKQVEDKYIAAVHTKTHINLIKNISSKKMTVSQRNKLAEKYNDVYFNEGSSESAYLAAGSLLDVAEKVARGKLDSAFAIVRPPGHHAEKSKPMGFCLFNNVAIAASYLLQEKELGIKKILIVDWDVHHGNATQKMFWEDSRVLFFSVHGHQNGKFYPGGRGGSHLKVGKGPGIGYNINVPWEEDGYGDGDYIGVWDHILIPVAKEFKPDIILISAGFDAAINDPLGRCCVTPDGFSILLKKLMRFGHGKIVMSLEGGYQQESLANSVLACMEALLEDAPIEESYEVYPSESAWKVIKDVREELGKYWQILAEKLPNRPKPLPEIYSSQSKEGDDSESVEEVLITEMSDAELAHKLGVDCVLVMKEAAIRLCQKEEQAKVMTADNHMASEIAARDKTLSIKETEIEVLKEQLACLEAKGKETEQAMKEETANKVQFYEDYIRKLEDTDTENQRIAIQEGENRLQRALNSEKELKEKLLARVQQYDVQIKELKEEQARVMIIKEKEIGLVNQQLACLEAKGKDTEARMTEALKKTVKAERDLRLLLTECLPEIVNRLLYSDEFVDLTRNLVNLGTEKGYQKALKIIQEKMLSDVTLEKMPGYDHSVTERYDQAVKDCYPDVFPYIQEIAANADKPLTQVMKISPKKHK